MPPLIGSTRFHANGWNVIESQYQDTELKMYPGRQSSTFHQLEEDWITNELKKKLTNLSGVKWCWLNVRFRAGKLNGIIEKTFPLRFISWESFSRQSIHHAQFILTSCSKKFCKAPSTDCVPMSSSMPSKIPTITTLPSKTEPPSSRRE